MPPTRTPKPPQKPSTRAIPMPIETIDRDLLARVAGGAARVTARAGSDDQLTAMLTQITSSISALANNKNQSDPTQMMLMMMMMGGFGGGGGGGVIGSAAPAGPPVINVDTSVLSHGGYGYLGGGGGGGRCCGSKKGW